MALQESNGFLGVRNALALDSEGMLSLVPSWDATCVVLGTLSEAAGCGSSSLDESGLHGRFVCDGELVCV